MLALVIVADGDKQAFVDTLTDLMTNADMGQFSTRVVVDASGDPEFRTWLGAKWGVFDFIDIDDYPSRPQGLELRIPAGVLLDGLQIGFG